MYLLEGLIDYNLKRIGIPIGKILWFGRLFQNNPFFFGRGVDIGKPPKNILPEQDYSDAKQYNPFSSPLWKSQLPKALEEDNLQQPVVHISIICYLSQHIKSL